MSYLERDFLSALYGKPLIVYGTGNAGKIVIPYLAGNPFVNLRGVTNSRIKAKDAGIYLETGLPLRSLQEWFRLLPEATILIAALRDYDVIYQKCRDIGFQNIAFAPTELIQAATAAAEDMTEMRLMSSLDAWCLANEVHNTHTASFSPFKGCHRGQNVAVVGCGPSLDFYSQIPEIPHIGTNSCFLEGRVNLDYYFLLHYIPEWCAELRKWDFVKFFAVNRNDNSDDKFPEYVIEENQGRRFFAAPLIGKMQFNIEYHQMMGFSSVIFPAIQFALYTRPKRILLVGCDCAQNGHFDGREQAIFEGDTNIPLWMEGYRQVKRLVSRHYPDTEIISVNPVGLKGMFRDVYTKGYLDAHPEIDRSQCEGLGALGFHCERGASGRTPSCAEEGEQQ